MMSIEDLLMEYAKEFWEECPDDFCVQDRCEDRVVFGGTNRVTWSIRRGFRIDRPYCTEKFIRHYEKIMGG